MDNPQATTTKEDLSWVGGIIDGEGCISLCKRNRKGTINYRPIILISNTDKRMIEEVSSILKKATIGHWVTWINPKLPTKTRPSQRMMGSVNISGFQRCEHALSILIPYIRTKRNQATTILEYIRYRLAIGYTKHNTYCETDDRYYQILGAMKKVGAPETIRGGRIGDKI